MSLRDPWERLDRKVFLSYEHPDVQFSLGDQAIALSPLADGGTGFGLSAGGSATLNPNVMLEAKAFASTSDRGTFGMMTACIELGVVIEDLVPESMDSIRAD